jgi:hypothetical protein
MPGRSARSNLRDVLSNLRHVIGHRGVEPPFLLIGRETVQFNLANDSWVDLGAFRALLEGDEGIRLLSSNQKMPSPCIAAVFQRAFPSKTAPLKVSGPVWLNRGGPLSVQAHGP